MLEVPMDVPVVHVGARVDKDHANSVSGGIRVYRIPEADDILQSYANRGNPVELASDTRTSARRRRTSSRRSPVSTKRCARSRSGVGCNRVQPIQKQADKRCH
jgi:hypothetical protein